MRASRHLLVLPLLLLLAGCGPRTPPGLFGERRTVVTVDVINQNASEAVVHALYDNQRQLLGTAPADSTVSYRIPWRMQGGLRIEFELAADEQPCITEVIILDPGDEFAVVIRSRVRYLIWCERPVDRL
jgi:hypothetical protein